MRYNRIRINEKERKYIIKSIMLMICFYQNDKIYLKKNCEMEYNFMNFMTAQF
jgi:hypothetical protein